MFRYFEDRARTKLVDELLYKVPKNVRNPALRVLVDNKQKVEKMCMFMAHELHRKMILDRRHSQIYEGQLLQIKLFLAMMEVANVEERKTEEPKKDTAYEKAKRGMESFRNIIHNKTS